LKGIENEKKLQLLTNDGSHNRVMWEQAFFLAPKLPTTFNANYPYNTQCY
jgi:hypothetical protein